MLVYLHTEIGISFDLSTLHAMIACGSGGDVVGCLLYVSQANPKLLHPYINENDHSYQSLVDSVMHHSVWDADALQTLTWIHPEMVFMRHLEEAMHQGDQRCFAILCMACPIYCTRKSLHQAAISGGYLDALKCMLSTYDEGKEILSHYDTIEEIASALRAVDT
jgi:hypothetical protein